MERKVGEVFEVEGKRYEVVEAPDTGYCYGCAFNERFECFSGQRGYCSDGARTDNKNVHFIEVK